MGYKGNPALNKKVDCDVLVADVRETSRKPDEMYSLLERLSPGTRKIEVGASASSFLLLTLSDRACFMQDLGLLLR